MAIQESSSSSDSFLLYFFVSQLGSRLPVNLWQPSSQWRLVMTVPQRPLHLCLSMLIPVTVHWSSSFISITWFCPLILTGVVLFFFFQLCSQIRFSLQYVIAYYIFLGCFPWHGFTGLNPLCYYRRSYWVISPWLMKRTEASRRNVPRWGNVFFLERYFIWESLVWWSLSSLLWKSTSNGRTEWGSFVSSVVSSWSQIKIRRCFSFLCFWTITGQLCSSLVCWRYYSLSAI